MTNLCKNWIVKKLENIYLFCGVTDKLNLHFLFLIVFAIELYKFPNFAKIISDSQLIDKIKD
jgi:hypothetical protein